ncbi:unnamed protein product [Durusdinium trenchii]
MPPDPKYPAGHRPLATEQLQRFLADAVNSRSEELTPLQSAFTSKRLDDTQNVVTASTVKELMFDGRRVSPALRLVKDALCRYSGTASPPSKPGRKPDPSVDRERLARARRLLYPSPELSQADPLPSKDSTRATSSRSTSAGPSVATPLLLATSRPMTSGNTLPHPWQALPKRPVTSPETSAALPEVSARLAFSAGSYGRRRALRGGRTRVHALGLTRESTTSSQSSIDSSPGRREGSRAPSSSKKLAQRMANLAGRLHHKVYKIRAASKGACALAHSCRKRLTMSKMTRQEEKNLATAAIHSRQIEEWGSPTSSQPVSTITRQRTKEMKKDEASLIAEGHKALFNAVSKMASTRSESPLRPNDSEGAREAKPGIFTSFKAHELSCEYNLPGGHVTQAWKLFKRYDVDNDGLLAPYEFQLLLRHVLRERFPSAKDVPRELFKEAIEIQNMQVTVTFADFLTWITRNAFQECLLLNDDQRFMRFIARKFQVHVTDVESVKRHFDSYSHHTGRMEYPEFHKLLALLLNLQDVLSLPESRVKSFWRELAGDHNGFVEFSDFIPWYLACFAGGDGSPLVNFYRKIRPIPILEEYE